MLCLALCSTALLSCKKDVQTKNTSTNETTTPRYVSSISQNFTTTNRVYYNSAFEDHFGNNLKDFNWSNDRAYIQDETFRVKLLANTLNWQGGIIAMSDIADGQSYDLSFDIRFDPDFLFREGGKAGFGFGIGQSIAGGNADDSQDGLGGSARLMWTWNGSYHKFKPYMYYQSMSNDAYAGEPSSTEYPQGNSSIKKGVWYTIKMTVKMNTEGYTNGKMIMSIQERGVPSTFREVINKDVKWASGEFRKITTLMFDTFRGGNTIEYESPETSYIYFDNVFIGKNY